MEATIKIGKRKPNGCYDGLYFGKDLNFVFQTQSSAPPVNYLLKNNTPIEIDDAACSIDNRDLINAEGVFYNFYKNKSVVLTFCVTKIINDIIL